MTRPRYSGVCPGLVLPLEAAARSSIPAMSAVRRRISAMISVAGGRVAPIGEIQANRADLVRCCTPVAGCPYAHKCARRRRCRRCVLRPAGPAGLFPGRRNRPGRGYRRCPAAGSTSGNRVMPSTEYAIGGVKPTSNSAVTPPTVIQGRAHRRVAPGEGSGRSSRSVAEVAGLPRSRSRRIFD